PNFFKQVFAGEYPTWVRCEVPQEIKLFGSQIHMTFSDCNFAPRWIDAQVTATDWRLVFDAIQIRWSLGAAEHRFNPCFELSQTKRLGDVIICAHLETKHLVNYVVFRREHQNRQVIRLFPKLPTNS